MNTSVYKTPKHILDYIEKEGSIIEGPADPGFLVKAYDFVMGNLPFKNRDNP